jgi:hypothetical protein
MIGVGVNISPLILMAIFIGAVPPALDAESMVIPSAIRAKASGLGLDIVKADVGKMAGGIRVELRNTGSAAVRNLRIEAECYSKKGIKLDEFKARREKLEPGERWIAKARSGCVRVWTVIDLNGER